METGCQILEIRERIAIRSSGQIEATVIAARPPRAIRLGDKMKRRQPRAIGAADNTSRLSLANSALACWRQRGSRRRALAKKGRPVDMVLDTMMWGKVLKI